MIRHIVMWKLHNPRDAPHFKAQLDTCLNLVPGMQTFEVAIRTPALEANCDVVLYSKFTDAAALAAYQNHPHHQQISAGLSPLSIKRNVLDHDLEGTIP